MVKQWLREKCAGCSEAMDEETESRCSSELSLGVAFAKRSLVVLPSRKF